MTVLAESQGRPDLDRDSQARIWSSAFELTANPATFLHALGVLTVGRSEIFTARLPFTRRFCGMLEEGGVAMIGVRAGAIRFGDCLDLLAVANTQARVARTRIARLRAPAVWIRNDDRENPALPAITLAQLAAISERPLQEVKAMVAPLVRDGALRIVHTPNGGTRLLAEPGYAEEGASGRMLRI